MNIVIVGLGKYGTLLTDQNFGSIWMPYVGWLLVLLFISSLVFIIIKQQKSIK